MLAQELISDSGISQIALGFFSALFAFLGVIAKMIFDNKKSTAETREAIEYVGEAANVAAEKAQAAVTNTSNISNGFASTVLGELREIRKDVQTLSTSVNRHLEWHLDKENGND